MIRYLKADLHRISRRIPRYIALAILYLLSIALFLIISDGRTIYQVVEFMTTIIPYICVLFGLFEYMFVYSDDLRAKTMQIAIGTGIHRGKVVLTKWLEALILCIFDLIVLLAIICICCAIMGVTLTAEPARDVVIILLFGLIKIMGCMAFTMIFHFRTQNTNTGMLVYIASALGIVNFAFDTILSIGFLNSLHLTRILFDNLVSVARARALIGSVSILPLLGIVLYFIAAYFITLKLFEKRELEF